jgi:hypothetical protein
MKKVLLVLSVLLIGCTTYQPIASVDPIYGYTTNTIENEFELQRLLRTDFKFRYDFAQFAIRQPLTWHWNNRMFRFGSTFNRYNYWNPYYPSNGYYYSQNYTQLWNDWLWGMDSGYWWNNWYNNSNNWYNGPYNNMGYNVVWNRSRRTSENTIANRVVNLQDTNKRRVKPNVTPIVTIPTYNNKPIITTKPVILNNNNRPSYNNKPIYNNKPSINNTNIRPSINRNTKPTINRNINTKRGGGN